MKNIKLTYFTPTYNREKLLPNLYQSLLNQTNKNFIWLIIDDGSKDGTEQLVKSWQKENKIQIEYIKKENGGKHTAIELSNQVCTTEFIACIDSDDTLTKEATNIFYSNFDKCSDSKIAGLVGPKTILNSNNNTTWNIDKETVYFYDLPKLLKNVNETTLVFKTDIAKQFHFPVFEGERFVTESVYYQQFFYDYEFVIFKDEVYVAEYQDDGYTTLGLKLFARNPKGYTYALRQNAALAVKHKSSFKQKVKKAMLYYGWKSLFKTSNEIAKEYPIPAFYRFVGWITIPLTMILLKKKLK